jgi:4-amino-4-deoxy-L-arabinose transferase-like glycosyltransferase
LKQYFWIILFTLIGGILRFYDLGGEPLWIDESLAALWVKESDLVMQEFIPVLSGKLIWFLGGQSEFWLRFTSALCGTLTIPAMYLVIRKRKNLAALIVALFPIFIFWSRMARPYAVAGLFIVLGWRWFWFYIPALLTTSTALIGVRLLPFKDKRWLILSGCLVLTAITFFIRPDAGRFTGSNDFFALIDVSSRWYYIPYLAFILYTFDIFLPYLDKKGFDMKKGKRV